MCRLISRTTPTTYRAINALHEHGFRCLCCMHVSIKNMSMSNFNTRKMEKTRQQCVCNNIIMLDRQLSRSATSRRVTLGLEKKKCYNIRVDVYYRSRYRHRLFPLLPRGRRRPRFYYDSARGDGRAFYAFRGGDVVRCECTQPACVVQYNST